MTDIAIRVQNLSKCYQIYDNPRDRLKQFVVPKLCRANPPLLKLFTTNHSLLSTGVSTPHSPQSSIQRHVRPAGFGCMVYNKPFRETQIKSPVRPELVEGLRGSY